MFIQTEDTPNPATIKFLPGQMVMEQGTAEFKSANEAGASVLARQLFLTQGVKTVFFSGDFISVTKTDDKEWSLLKPRILATIMDHYMTGMPVIDLEAYQKANQKDAAEISEIEKQIIEIIDTRVRPAVAQDGGDIEFDRFESGVVYLHMRGACSGCPSSTATLKMGIENMLKHFIPEVQEVRPVAA
jgi:Fe-S cluster biogenesis protein NfuA